MKKILALLLLVAILLTIGCGNNESITEQPSPTQLTTENGEANEETPEPTSTPAPTPAPDVDASTVDTVVEKWNVCELSFESTKVYEKNSQADVVMDAVFTNKANGTTLTIPSFWDGNNTFKVRFAPTLCGVWEYKTACTTDDSLEGLKGTIGVNEYKGELEVYKHGFVTTQADKKYFVYDDGTPFFYLGDTHWTMFTEEYSSKGASAGAIETSSHFKYIVDKRVEQGFTVYQSEPISAPFNLKDGSLSKTDVKGFQTADKYFQYIAENGLTHANAQFFFSTDITAELAENTEYLEQISRYWVARFGAYPVMWTLGQEIDNDRYTEHGDQSFYTAETNPWVKIAEYIHKYDAYSHPLTGHQEHYARTTVTGAGTDSKRASNNGKSAFLSDEVTAKTGHSWYGAQWSTPLNQQVNFVIARDYWSSSKVAVDYESSYCYQGTKDFGARARGWIAYLNGFYGYGYGARDIWYYNSTYESNQTSNDGYDTVTPEDKKIKWSAAIELPSGYQVCYMKEFFEKLEWWRLTPRFDDNNYFTPDNTALYSVASNGNKVYVVYFYNHTAATGKISGLKANEQYSVTIFNPGNNKYGEAKEFTADADGTYRLPQKETTTDIVMLIEKK